MIDFILNHAHSYWFGLVVCLAFVGVLARFSIRPITRAIDAREASLHRDLDEAAEANRQAAGLRKELEARMTAADQRVAEVLREARDKAGADRERLLAEGRRELAEFRERTLLDIEAARQEAVEDLREEIAEISVFTAGRILDAELDAERHRDLVRRAIAAYADGAEGN